jgi:hypothetical protein
MARPLAWATAILLVPSTGSDRGASAPLGWRPGGAAGGAAAAAGLPCAGLSRGADPPEGAAAPKGATPLLHETLAWHGFQLEQQPIGCQEVPAWLKRMRDRELAMPICPGLEPSGWIEAQGLIAFPDQPPFREKLCLLLPEGRVLGSATARHLIRILRQRVEKAEEEGAVGGDLTAAGMAPVESAALPAPVRSRK